VNRNWVAQYVFSLVVLTGVWGSLAGQPEAAQAEPTARFPSKRPENGSFSRPADKETLDISPPGFCWWRLGRRGQVFYRLRIVGESAGEVYASPKLNDPVHVPDRVLQPGEYIWTVEAEDADGDVLDTLPPRSFTIAGDPIPMAWVEADELLRRVPEEHPRLLFPKAELPQIRQSLATTRKKAYDDLKAIADRALKVELMKKPDFDRFDRDTQYEARRVAYRSAYHEFSNVYHKGMLPMALVYQLTGDEKYGRRAKAHLLNLTNWETDGIASLEPSFDEIGLRIARTAAQGYDWLWDVLSEEERIQGGRL
jgi:hypothetical protein